MSDTTVNHHEDLKDSVLEDQIQALLFQREKRGEQIANYARFGILLVLLNFSLTTFFVGHSPFSHVMIQWIAIFVAFVYSLAVYFIIKRDLYRPFYKYVSVVQDNFLVWLAIFGATYNGSPLYPNITAMIFLYPLLIGLASIRNDKNLVWFATSLAALSYATIWGYFYADIQALPYIADNTVPSSDIVSFILKTAYIFLTGVFIAYTTRQTRRVAYQSAKTSLERDKLLDEKKMFSKFLSNEVVDGIVKGNISIELGGEKRTITLLFVDIRGFTTLTENMEPRELVEYMNRYFDIMSKIIFKNKGTLDKYMGDAIMAFFGAPVSYGNDVQRAVLSALEIKNAVDKFNFDHQNSDYPPLRIGIGLHTSQVIVGNIGSSERMDYTALGDGVNVASRVETLNKKTGTTILLTETTADAVENDFQTKSLGSFLLRGKSTPIKIFELIDRRQRPRLPGAAPETPVPAPEPAGNGEAPPANPD